MLAQHQEGLLLSLENDHFVVGSRFIQMCKFIGMVFNEEKIRKYVSTLAFFISSLAP